MEVLCQLGQDGKLLLMKFAQCLSTNQDNLAIALTGGGSLRPPDEVAKHDGRSKHTGAELAMESGNPIERTVNISGDESFCLPGVVASPSAESKTGGLFGDKYLPWGPCEIKNHQGVAPTGLTEEVHVERSKPGVGKKWRITLAGTAVRRAFLGIPFPLLLTCFLYSISIAGSVEAYGDDMTSKPVSANIVDPTKHKPQFSLKGTLHEYGNFGSHVFDGMVDTQGVKHGVSEARDSTDANQLDLEELQHVQSVRSNLRHWTGRKTGDFGVRVDGVRDEHSGLYAVPNMNERRTDVENAGTIRTKPYTINDGIKHLKELKREGLHRRSNPAEVITEVKQVVKSHLDHMIPMQEYLHDGNLDGAGSALKSMIRGSNTLVDMRKELTNDNGPNSFSLDGTPNDQVAKVIPAGVFDEIVEHAQEVHKLLDGIDLSIFSTSHLQEPLKNEQIDVEQPTKFDNSFDFAGGQHRFFRGVPSENLQSDSNFWKNFIPSNSNVFKYPASMKHYWRHSQLSNKSMPKLGKYTKFHDDDVVMAKHQLRVEALGDTCGRVCELEEVTCLCGRLFDCISDMTEYDLAVLVAGGFIDTNPSSDTFGNFSVPANQLNLYNADQGVAEKLSGLKSRASVNSINTENCNAVLRELFTACDPDESTCMNPNIQSFSVSTGAVCNVVNSNKKLLFEVVGEEFDGFVDKFTEAPCKPLSYDVCAEFVVQFDKLYQGRNTVEYPLANPMLKTPSNYVHDQVVNNKAVFDRVQFPIRYNFQQDQTTGVVTREFPPDVHTVPTRYFLLTNPTSGKVLGLRGGSCADFTPIEVQDRVHIGNVDSQQFTLTSDGRLESKLCNEKVLSNKWDVGGVHSCMSGNELMLQSSSDTNADLQRWTFVRDASGIINSLCGQWNGNLAISAIEDDSIMTIDYSDTIPVQFINPESNMAIGLASGGEECPDGVGVKLQTATGNDGQTFYIKQAHDVGKEVHIYSKACPEMVLEGQVSYFSHCEANSALHLHPLSITGHCRDSDYLYYSYVQKTVPSFPATCNQFCQELDQSEYQVGFEYCASHFTCRCLYMAGTLPSVLPYGVQTVEAPGVPGVSRVHYGNGEAGWECFSFSKMNTWRIKDGKVEGAKCKGMVMAIGSSSTPQGSNIILAPTNERGWHQAWSIKSNAARLLTDNGRPSQAWKAVSAQPAYDYALLSGFPGLLSPRNFELVIDGSATCPGSLAVPNNECLAAAIALGREKYPNNIIPEGLTIGDWAHLPCGCSLWKWDIRIAPHYNTRTTACSGSGGSNRGLVCKSNCLSSTINKGLAKSAMRSCDESMSLLIGRSTSVGTLRTIASLVSENGTEYMPGTCCLDVTTNSDFFGYRYNPKLTNSFGTKMTCQHRGPWHLGISEEACENAGGKWYRTPCITLQSCIDNRPPRFDLEAPSTGSCRDTMGRMSTAFVSSSTALPNFPFTSTKTGCFKFCQTLPDYPLQIGMEVEGSGSAVTKCICLYNNGKVPSKALLPEYATRSPSKFSLMDATGKSALGLSQSITCTSDEISVELQTHNGISHQEFQITHDGRIVSAACPGKVLTAANTEAGSHLVASSPRFNALESLKQLPGVAKVRVQLKGTNYLQLREVQVFDVNGNNVAMGKIATQSSDYRSDYLAENAVNGIISGDDGSITRSENQAWWEVDLDVVVPVQKVVIYNRVCCTDRLSNSVVSLLDNSRAVLGMYEIGDASSFEIITMDVSQFQQYPRVRKVRVQLKGTNYLNLREVKVFDVYGNDVARGKSATQSSDYRSNAVAGHAVNGITSGDDVSHTRSENRAWWEVDLGVIVPVQRVVIYNRVSYFDRLSNSVVSLLDNSRAVLGMYEIGDASSLDVITIEIAQFQVSGLQRWHFNHGNIASVMFPNLEISLDVSHFQQYPRVRKVRVQLKGTNYLNLREVEVFDVYGNDVARGKSATQSSDYRSNAVAGHAVNGITSGDDVSHTRSENRAWWEVDLGGIVPVQRVVIYNRDSYFDRLSNSVVFLLDNSRAVLGMYEIGDASSLDVITIEIAQFQVSGLQRWHFNHGNIANVTFPNLEISSEIQTGSLRSFYFALENPKSHLTMGALGTSCQSSMSLELQTPVFGSPNQQFYLHGDTIVSVMCPSLAINILNGNCQSGAILQLSHEGDAWEFKDDQTIESVKCRTMFIAISSGSTGAVTSISRHQFSSTLPVFDSSTERNEVNYNVNLPLQVGASIALLNCTVDKHCSWMKRHERFNSLEGPFSFVNPTNGFAFGVEDGTCAHGLMMKTQRDDYSNVNQQFYFGRQGFILSTACVGLVVTADIEGDCGNTTSLRSLKLLTYMIGEKKMKWRLNHDGSIESVKCPGVVIGSDSSSHAIVLADRETEDVNQIWSKQNVRLVDSSNDLIIHFAEPGYTVSDLQQYSGRNGDTNCYPPNLAFNRGFENFVLNTNIPIRNAADEDQCEHAREEMGFEPDHPFDTEVCKQFNDFMCDPFFSGVDHVTESLAHLAEPPQFKQVGYNEIGYNNVEYEAPAYAEDDELPFETIELPKPTELNPDVPLASESGGKDNLVGMQKHWLDLQNALMVFQHTFDALSFHYDSCDEMPDTICIPVIMGMGGCVTNPVIYICKGVAYTLRFYSYIILLGLDIAYQAVDRDYEISTLGPNEAYYGFMYSKSTHEDLRKHIDWSRLSLSAINQNTHNQHQSLRKHLQDRHFAMETNIGQDIFDARNSLGQSIVDAQNANGQGIVDARNAIATQHNQMLEWLKPTMCQVYEAMNGGCIALIGPLEEGQINVPLELHWPEGQPTMIESLRKIEETLANGVTKASEDRREGAKMDKMNAVKGKVDVIGGKVDAIESSVKAVVEVTIVATMSAVEGKIDTKMSAVEGKIDAKMSAVEGKIDAKMSAVEGKIDAKMNAVNGKIDTVEGKVTAMEAMMVQLVKQNMKLVQLIEHKVAEDGSSIENTF